MSSKGATLFELSSIQKSILSYSKLEKNINLFSKKIKILNFKFLELGYFFVDCP